MKKKILSLMILLILTGAIIANHIITYAAKSTPPLYVNLTATDKNGTGYGIGDPKNAGEYIWNLTTYDSNSEDAEPSDTQRNLYCVNAEEGQTWYEGYPEQNIDPDQSKILSYELNYDFQTERKTVLEKIQNDPESVIYNLLDTEREGSYYRELLWLFDNLYLLDSNETEEEAKARVEEYLIKQLGLTKDAISGSTIPTAQDIIAIQRMAIWYFTNRTADPTDEDTYDKTAENLTQWLNIITEDNTEYSELAQVSRFRNNLAMALYRNLISSAKAGASQYTEENNYKIDSAPVNVKTEGLTQIETAEGENDKYIVEMLRDGANYLIGPIVIQKNNELDYNMDISVEAPNVQNLTYKYIHIDAQGNKTEKTEEQLTGLTEGFYISVPRNNVNDVKISIAISYRSITKKLWLDGDEVVNNDGEITSITSNLEQPIVEIIQEDPSKTIEFISKPQEFDLALRKYITAVEDKNENTKNIPNVRNLDNISLDSLSLGTTATYKHRKDPVVVESGDKVTYTLRIYNEGNKTGYATKIIDQLPKGLLWDNESSAIVVSKGPNNEQRNKYQLIYNLDNNQIQLTLEQWPEEIEGNVIADGEGYVKDIQPYTSGNLDYETIEIKCIVAQTPDTKNAITLTNVAWIAGAFDSEAQKAIPTDNIIDRDSEPQRKPAVDQNSMTEYRGSTSGNELTDSEYYYAGQEDDDDFEKLVIMPVIKKFDLALFKHIAAISKDKIIEDGEYVTDTGNKNGKYLRAPEVTNIDPNTGKITYRQDDKAALTVEPGDYVLYTIRVYNEGEVNGYASEIKDQLPIGLEFVEADENADYFGIWNLDGYDSEGRQIVSTTWFAQGNGAELNATENSPNYKANLLTALNKEGAISNEEPANPDFIDAQVLCRVVEQSTSDRVLVNFAQISDDSDENGEEIEDIDSTPDEWLEPDDDQDVERIKLQCFDLSLRKFITVINGESLRGAREPKVNVMPLTNGTSTTAIYNHPKTPVEVQKGDKLIYTIRVYNEGDINGYASEVKDYLPPYLTYVEESDINEHYGWQISEDGRIATTTYLENNELEAFNGNELHYADLQIECIVSDNAPLAQKQTNIAEISEYTYNGNTVSKDIDSTSDNVESKIPTDENLPTYKDDKINDSYVPGNEDDDDFEKIYVKTFDLSLRKFVTDVNGKSLNGAREPQVDVTPLKNGTSTTAIYNHPKTPVALKIGDKVVYTIRVYNEGETAGYANEVKDYLPPYLQYIEDSSINKQYGWQISEDGRIATTTYLSNKEIAEFNGTTLDYEDIKIECLIKENAIPDESITNIAEISEYKYGETIKTEDIDSESDNIEENMPEDKDLPEYKEDKQNQEYVPGNEDDDDFEKVYVKEFDLALRKFITRVQGKETTTRVPQIKIENGIISYQHPKDAITVHVGDVVIYTLRIYNEGEIDGYAKEIADDIPEYLEYLPEESTNKEYMWKMYDKDGKETENVEEAVKVKTQYLSKEKSEDNLIKAFDGETVSYKDIKIAFKVKDPNSNTHIITNHAQIADDSDEDGNIIKDKDSETDEWNEGEDDQDIENVKVEYFDLSILKFVSKVIVIEDGKEKITETGYNGHENPEPVVKVELHKKKLKDVVVKFGYGITITNEGDIPGYATEITDYVPEGLKFNATDNPKWTDEGNNVISTKQLENTLLQPGESKTIEVIFTWINNENNLAQKTNTVEISEDKNQYDVPDKDSTPDNKKEGEDDIDIAKVILAISTGRAKTYFTLTLGLLAVVGVGIMLIKKYVL